MIAYIACPYSSPYENVRRLRFEAANRCAGALMARGEVVFSPISHTHPIAEQCELPKGWEYWNKYDRAMLSQCVKVYVLTIDGWMESVGVAAELKIANELGLPVEYITEDGEIWQEP